MARARTLEHKARVAALIAATAVAFASALPAAPERRDPGNHFFQQTFGDLPAELERARAQSKDGIFLFFEQEECPFCHRMKQDVLNRPRVQDYYRDHFLIFSIDIEGDVPVTTFEGREMPMKDFAFKINRVRATPVMAFYDLDGEQVVKYIGATSGVQEFMWLGQYMVNDIYEEMPFTRYKRQRREEQRTTGR